MSQILMENTKKATTSPSLFGAFIPIIVLIGLLILNVSIWGDATLDGSNQTALIFAGGVAAVIALWRGKKWSVIQKKIVKTIGKSMSSILILLMIGALSGTWLLSGVIPLLVYYGLEILHPSYFLTAALIVSALVSLATGSSWSTIATVGVALIGVGNTMGIDPAISAGAIISGAYFGDKLSPLSDTTNLAPAMAGTDLYTHIRYMLYTTIPSFGIALIAFLIIGFNIETHNVGADTETVRQAIAGTFNITPWLLAVPAFLIFVIVRKVAPLPSMLLGVLAGGVFAVIFQPQLIEQVSGISGNYAEASYKAVIQAVYGEIQITTPVSEVNDLFVTHGMSGMLLTIWLILSAMIFGGAMESGGMLERITGAIIKRVKRSGSLIASTLATSIFFNFTASDQYIAIVVPGRMFQKAYKDNGLKPEVLSRTLEDSGTLTSVLVPWNTCGATQARVLGVATGDYFVYAIFNWVNPIISLLIAYLNIKIRRITDFEKTPDITQKSE